MIPTSAVTQKRKTLLIVEDDNDIRESLAEVLEAEGYEVITAANGEEGIEALRRTDAPLPNLIVLDLMMPVKDGFEFRMEQTMNPEWKNIPVVVMTADGNAIKRMQQTGGNSFLRKPVDLAEVLSVVELHSR